MGLELFTQQNTPNTPNTERNWRCSTVLSGWGFHISYIYYRVHQTHPSLTQSPPAAEAVKNSGIHELIHTCIPTSLAHPPLPSASRDTDIYGSHHHFRGRLVIRNFCTHTQTQRGGVEPWCITSCQWWHIGGIHASLIDASIGDFFLVYWSRHCHEFKKIAITREAVTVCNLSKCSKHEVIGTLF